MVGGPAVSKKKKEKDATVKTVSLEKKTF